MTDAHRGVTDEDGGHHHFAAYRGWWSTDLRLWWRDFDALEHLTASAYCAVYQEAFAAFMEQAWDDPNPSWVVARMSIAYHHEVRRDDSPIQVYVAVRRVGRASFETTLVLCSASGRVCSTAETHNAAWDREGRCSRPLTEVERSRLLRHVGSAAATSDVVPIWPHVRRLGDRGPHRSELDCRPPFRWHPGCQVAETGSSTRARERAVGDCASGRRSPDERDVERGAAA